MTSRLPQPYHVYLDLDFINNDVDERRTAPPLGLRGDTQLAFLGRGLL